MDKPDLSKKPALWLGLRQTESLRESVRDSFRENVIPDIRKWFSDQDTPDYADVPDEMLVWHALCSGFEDGYGLHPELLVRGSNAPTERLVNAGGERSGAGWKSYPNFIITSALVRLLGAWEQYERDVLKALFYYRPSGMLGPDSEQIVQEVDVAVIEEQGVSGKNSNSLEYAKPVLWTWMSRPSENNVERARIFKNVFGINMVETKDQRKLKDQWYENRNAVAHGRRGVNMTLRDYVDLDVLVAKSMTYISRQCEEKLKILV